MRAASLITIAVLTCGLTGCTPVMLGFLGGERHLAAIELRRAADGATAYCETGMYPAGGIVPALSGSERKAARALRACVLACHDAGFEETGQAAAISDAAAFTEKEKLANAPRECRQD